MDEKRSLLRHTLATLAYRATRALEDAPQAFANFDGAGRRPIQILAHMGDLFDWALSMANGTPAWKEIAPAGWEPTCTRFFDSLRAFDARLAGSESLACEPSVLFQGPVADALTHTGQLAMLRRLHGAPMKGESYNRAHVVIGRIGMEQDPPDPKYEFD